MRPFILLSALALLFVIQLVQSQSISTPDQVRRKLFELKDEQRRLQSEFPPSGSCNTVTIKAKCISFTACKWTTRCRKRPTSSPTTSPPSRSPSRAPSSTLPTKSPTLMPSASPTRSPTKRPTTPTKKPTKHPTAQPSKAPIITCEFPPSFCGSVKAKGRCRYYDGCAWNTRRKRCLRKQRCPYPPAPTKSPNNMIPNPACRVPLKGCPGIKRANCKKWSGCRWSGKCIFVRCNSEIIVTKMPSTAPTPEPTTLSPSQAPIVSTLSPTRDPNVTDSPGASPTSSPTLSPVTEAPSSMPTLSPTVQKTRTPTRTIVPTPVPTALPPKQICAVPSGGCSSVSNITLCTTFDGCVVSGASCVSRSQCNGNVFDCNVRGVTFDLATTMLPGCLRADANTCDRQRREVYHGLGLQTTCGDSGVILPCTAGGCTLRTDLLQKEKEEEHDQFFFEVEFFVHPVLGVDKADNIQGWTRALPFKTLPFAVQVSRTFTGMRRQIVLMGPAKHRLEAPIVLNDLDSELSFFGEDGATISGALQTKLQWRAASEVGPNVLVADLPEDIARRLDKLAPMFVNGEPAIRARWPNLASYLDKQFAPGTRLNNWRRKTRLSDVSNRVNIRITPGLYGRYTQARGGMCEGQFDPPVGFFCDPGHEAQGGCAYTMAGGVNVQGSLATTLRASEWKMTDVFLHTFHPYKWGLWTFQLANPPTMAPTSQQPSASPSTSKPSSAPTVRPSKSPITSGPSKAPTTRPSFAPTVSKPTSSPTKLPTTLSPTAIATNSPSDAPSAKATDSPTNLPTVATQSPSGSPTNLPTVATQSPSGSPTNLPTVATQSPSGSPTNLPTVATQSPSGSPTKLPSLAPSMLPTTLLPTTQPTSSPTTQDPSKTPSCSPTFPTYSPSSSPSTTPTTAEETAPENARRVMQSANVSDESLFSDAAGDYSLYFEKGGFQEARGDCGSGGGDWFVENTIQLLDAANEFYLDLTDSAGAKVYFIPNDTVVDSNTVIEFAVAQELIRVEGSLASPVRKLNFRHLRFEMTYPTHMEKHEIPSGGDWAVHRGAALFLEGVEDASVYDCTFWQLGGNGVFLSKYARDVSIRRNEFFALGSSAVLLVGDPRFDSTAPHDRSSDENHVERILIEENMANELGLAVKQSSAVFVAISRSVLIRRNVFFNIARAAVAYNDGFGGNTTLEETVMFNTVMETLDHGPFNVWDRQQWIQNPNVNPQLFPFVVRRNLMIGNSNGAKGVDLDDGSRNYEVSDNVLVSALQKFKGQDIDVTGNLMFPIDGGCIWMTPINNDPGRMKLEGNTCVTQNLPPYYFYLSSADEAALCRPRNFIARNNRFFGPAMKKTFRACGAGQTTWNTWRNTYKQDAGTQKYYSMPTATDQFLMVLNKLRSIFPQPYW